MSLGQTIASLICIFNKYAGKDGDPKTLTKAELAELFKAEYILPPNTDKAEVDKFFKMLDDDGDGLINFQEFVTFVGAIATICK